MADKILIVSRHDYRTEWRASLHFLADAYHALGSSVKFVSVGFSPLSLLSHDHRKALSSDANRWQTRNGIECFLWRSPIHPFNRGLGSLAFLTNSLFKWWINSSCSEMDRACGTADIIIVESGIAAALVGRIRRCAPNAKLIYVASDLLETVNAHPFIEEQLYRDRSAISHIVVVARAMAKHFQDFGCPVHFVTHGISKSDFDTIGPSPYLAGKNIVTVGSMLFDPTFFEVASENFPDIHFHLIGTPKLENGAENITEYGRMEFTETLPFLKYADAGVAPYHDMEHADYLVDSSMKLMQYDYLKLNAICPDFAAGEKPNRYGYRPGDTASVTFAIENALGRPYTEGNTEVLDWKDVANRYKDF